MDRTKRGRACEHEYLRFRRLIDQIPISERHFQGENLREDESSNPVAIHCLVHSGCEVVDKCIVTLATLLAEVNQLTIEGSEKFFPTLLLYGEDVYYSPSLECPSIQAMAHFLPFLRHLFFYLERVYQVFGNLMQQIRGFHSLDSSIMPFASDCHLSRAWRGLGDLLIILLQIDEISNSRPVIRQHWNSYIRALMAAQHNPIRFGSTSDELCSLIASVTKIEEYIMAGNALRNCYERSYSSLDGDKIFASRMHNTIMEMYLNWEKSAAIDIPDKRRLMVIVCLSVFYHHHFPSDNRKLIKMVWNSHKKIVAFHLIGDITWIPCLFLLREISEISHIIDKKTLQFIQRIKTNLYAEQSDAMLDEAISYIELADEWQSELRMEIRKPEPRNAATSLRIADVLLKGSRIADIMCRLLKTVLNSYHGSLQMSKRTAYSVFKIIETIKAISQNFSTHWRSLLESCQMAGQQWRCHSLNLLDRTKSTLNSSDNERLAALQIAVSTLLSTSSRNRLSVCGVALELTQYKKIMRGNDIIELDGLLNRLETLCRPWDLVDRVTNCSFLVFHRDLINIYWDTVADRMPTIENIRYFMSALSDCVSFVVKAQYSTDSDTGKIFKDHIYESIRKGFLIPLCGAIENDLRVLTHKHLEVDERDKTSKEKADFYRHILRNPEIRLNDYIINIKAFVTRYLEKTFYNLTVVALHDYHAYSKMAVLAEQRYGLKLTDGNLPHYSIGQGLDVIHVMKTLNQFVLDYNYCLNQQIFIEKQSPNRSLRVLTADHMANSLRTHGMGVLNTSVNITYQLLRKKFSVFNQFLANEHVHAQLQKDIRYFNENRENLKKMFPVKRAEKFNRAVSKLGMLTTEDTYMDEFRSLITQIGNALGFVRSMVSGAASVASQMKKYDVLEAEPLTSNFVGLQSSEFPTATVWHFLDELRIQTKRNRNYIKMLIDVFRDGFKNHEKFAHLSLFYMIIPALTMNYVDHMLTCRDRLKKRTQHNMEMTFTNDGFVLGLAYLVTVLGIWPQFSALNWFQSMSKKYDADFAQLSEEMKTAKDSRGAHLKSARLKANEKEYKLLSFTFQSARVFFSIDEDAE